MELATKGMLPSGLPLFYLQLVKILLGLLGEG